MTAHMCLDIGAAEQRLSPAPLVEQVFSVHVYTACNQYRLYLSLLQHW